MFSATTKNIGLLFIALLGFTTVTMAKSQPGKQLESMYDSARQYNQQGKFKQSIEMYNAALRSDTLTAEERFYLYLFKSYTYKWLSDYKSVERNLLLADQSAKKTAIYPELKATLNIELATFFFDINQYHRADSVMKIMRATGFIHVEPYARSLIFMQEAYIYFLNKEYTKAEPLYLSSISLMNQNNGHCNTPIVYWKLQALYLAQGRIQDAEKAIKAGLAISKDCEIEKYTMFMYAEAAIHYAKIGHFEQAFSYRLKQDSVQQAIDQKQHVSELAGLEKEFQQEYEAEKHQLEKKTLEAQTNFNYLMAALIGCAVFVSSLIYSWLRYRKSKRYRVLKNQFTADLFHKVEEERKRIASDLHDGISHELLAVSQAAGNATVSTSINTIIQEIRHISRNLHPVMFEKLGLKNSIEHLATRLQESTGIIISTEIGYDRSISPVKELQLYRIVQEALSNSIKYSEAIAIRIGLLQTSNSLVLQIQDNGKGFDAKSMLAEGKGFGLQSIIERSEAIGGKAQIKSGATGTHITVTL